MKQHIGLVHNVVYRHFRHIPKNIAEYDDLIQIGFEGLMDAQRAWDPTRGSKFSSYARRRIQGKILDWLEHYGRHHIPTVPVLFDIASNHTPEHNLERKQIAEIVRKEIRKLRPQHRHVIRMVFFKEIEQRRIAEEMNCTEGNISLHKSKALNALRERLKKYGIISWPVFIKEVVEEDGEL